MARLPSGSTSSNTSDYETYSDTIFLVKGDTFPNMQFTLKDSNSPVDENTTLTSDPATWKPIDLTNCSVVLKVKPEGATTFTELLLSMVEASEGKVALIESKEVIANSGVILGEIEITNAGTGAITTVYEQLKFIVRDDF